MRERAQEKLDSSTDIWIQRSARKKYAQRRSRHEEESQWRPCHTAKYISDDQHGLPFLIQSEKSRSASFLLPDRSLMASSPIFPVSSGRDIYETTRWLVHGGSWWKDLPIWKNGTSSYISLHHGHHKQRHPRKRSANHVLQWERSPRLATANYHLGTYSLRMKRETTFHHQQQSRPLYHGAQMAAYILR